jgi:hypothetical protein
MKYALIRAERPIKLPPIARGSRYQRSAIISRSDLFPRPNVRRANNDAMARPKFIRRARELGVDVAAIRELLEMMRNLTDPAPKLTALLPEIT